MSYRDAVKSLTPPLLLQSLRRLRGRQLRFSGTLNDWTEARAQSDGYATDVILQRVAEGTRAVLQGRAAYERDGVLFDRLELPFHVLAALLRAAAMNGGRRLEVIDFGGALGSTYRQVRSFLTSIDTLRWQIVEQPAFVDLGVREFTTSELTFSPSLDALHPLEQPAVILASSVLQYLEDPHHVLRSFAAPSASHLVIDRTPVSGLTDDRLCIQHTPSDIYPASYPMWILSRRHIIERLDAHWSVLAEFNCPEGRQRTADGLSFEFRGLILERRS